MELPFKKTALPETRLNRLNCPGDGNVEFARFAACEKLSGADRGLVLLKNQRGGRCRQFEKNFAVNGFYRSAVAAEID